jgi:hypothetical protein
VGAREDTTVFDDTVKFNIDAGYDACAYLTLTPYPGRSQWGTEFAPARCRAATRAGPLGKAREEKGKVQKTAA